LAAPAASFLANYKGMPYEDGQHAGGAQKIPGRVMCAYYDRGGEGVAYHDSDAKNRGSGGLNPANGTYLNEFRMREPVDTSYTKYHDHIDDNPYEKVHPPEGLLYVGWTEPGEWFNITVDLARAGVYSGDLLYTSNRGGTISLDVNGKDVTGPVTIVSTFNKADPIAWRQWHHCEAAAAQGKECADGAHSDAGKHEPGVFRLQGLGTGRAGGSACGACCGFASFGRSCG
jgi:hypothetical protein